VIVAIAWGAAAVFAVVILGACAFELKWKRARLRADLIALQALVGELGSIQRQIGAVAMRLSPPDSTN
jgi:hypothetical protein